METLIVTGCRQEDETGMGWLEVMDDDGHRFLHPVQRGDSPVWDLFIEDIGVGKHPVVTVEPWALWSWE